MISFTNIIMTALSMSTIKSVLTGFRCSRKSASDAEAFQRLEVRGVMEVICIPHDTVVSILNGYEKFILKLGASFAHN